jgi:hypothetical protein
MEHKMKLQMTIATIALTLAAASVDAKPMCVGMRNNGRPVRLSPKICMQNTGKPYNFNGYITSSGRLIPEEKRAYNSRIDHPAYPNAAAAMKGNPQFNYFMTKQAR